MALGFTQTGSSTAYTPVSLDDLANLPTTLPAGASNPFSLAWFNANTPTTAANTGGVTAWLQANSTAVMVVAAALFALALFGGKRR